MQIRETVWFLVLRIHLQNAKETRETMTLIREVDVKWFASCICGWHGPHRVSKNTTERDLSAHAKTCESARRMIANTNASGFWRIMYIPRMFSFSRTNRHVATLVWHQHFVSQTSGSRLTNLYTNVHFCTLKRVKQAQTMTTNVMCRYDIQNVNPRLARYLPW